MGTALERYEQGIFREADILIIGGGLSGAMLAAQLLRLPGRREVLIVEPRSELGRGEAYSAVELGHTLNGNAARMSVDPDNADDLTQWLTAFIEAGGWPEADQQHVPISELFPPRGCLASMCSNAWPRPARWAHETVRPPSTCAGRPWTCGLSTML